MAYAVASATSGCAYDGSKPRTACPRTVSAVIARAKRRRAARWPGEYVAEVIVVPPPLSRGRRLRSRTPCASRAAAQGLRPDHPVRRPPLHVNVQPGARRRRVPGRNGGRAAACPSGPSRRPPGRPGAGRRASGRSTTAPIAGRQVVVGAGMPWQDPVCPVRAWPDGQPEVQPEETTGVRCGVVEQERRAPLIGHREVEPAVAVHVRGGDPSACASPRPVPAAAARSWKRPSAGADEEGVVVLAAHRVAGLEVAARCVESISRRRRRPPAPAPRASGRSSPSGTRRPGSPRERRRCRSRPGGHPSPSRSATGRAARWHRPRRGDPLRHPVDLARAQEDEMTLVQAVGRGDVADVRCRAGRRRSGRQSPSPCR